MNSHRWFNNRNTHPMWEPHRAEVRWNELHPLEHRAWLIEISKHHAHSGPWVSTIQRNNPLSIYSVLEVNANNP